MPKSPVPAAVPALPARAASTPPDGLERREPVGPRPLPAPRIVEEAAPPAGKRLPQAGEVLPLAHRASALVTSAPSSVSAARGIAASAIAGKPPLPGSSDGAHSSRELFSATGTPRRPAHAPFLRTPLALAMERRPSPAAQLTGAGSVPAARLGEALDGQRHAASRASRVEGLGAGLQPATAAAAPLSRERAASLGAAPLEGGVEPAPVARSRAAVVLQRGLAPSLVTAPEAAAPASEALFAGRENQRPDASQAPVSRPAAAAIAPVVAPLMTLERVQLLHDAPPLTTRSLPVADQVDGNRRSVRASPLQLDAALATDPTALRAQPLEAQRAEGVLSRFDSAVTEQALPQLARDVLRLAAQNATQLRLQLNPEELGTLDVRLRVDGDRVHVSVVAQQGLTRELLEAQLPQLKTLLAEGGLELGDVDLRQQGERDQPARRGPGEELASPPTRPTPDADERVVPATRPAGGRLIDAFA